MSKAPRAPRLWFEDFLGEAMTPFKLGHAQRTLSCKRFIRSVYEHQI